MLKCLPIFLLLSALLANNVFATQDSALENLAASVDKQCQEQGIPGLALVVIKDGNVVLQHCYGYADQSKKLPVNSQTIFPVGSMSKPFTSILTAAMVSDGKLCWDDPITKTIPWFKLPIRTEDSAAEVQLCDLLSHRTGFFTMHLIQEGVNWAQQPDFTPAFDREGIMRAMLACKPDTTFRASHNYSNVSMVAVAEACAVVADKNWDDLLALRLLKPLGMNRSGSISADLPKFDNVAVGYMQGPDGVAPVELLDMDCIAPAGGVWSCLDDLSNWLQFLLQEGQFNGKRIVSPEAITETWSEHIHDANVGGQFPGARYGLGWFLTESGGHQVVEHAGNALGYSANLAMIPAEKSGYILISNVLPNMLQMTLNDEVWQALGLLK